MMYLTEEIIMKEDMAMANLGGVLPLIGLL